MRMKAMQTRRSLRAFWLCCRAAVGSRAASATLIGRSSSSSSSQRWFSAFVAANGRTATTEVRYVWADSSTYRRQPDAACRGPNV